MGALLQLSVAAVQMSCGAPLPSPTWESWQKRRRLQMPTLLPPNSGGGNRQVLLRHSAARAPPEFVRSAAGICKCCCFRWLSQVRGGQRSITGCLHCCNAQLPTPEFWTCSELRRGMWAAEPCRGGPLQQSCCGCRHQVPLKILCPGRWHPAPPPQTTHLGTTQIHPNL